MSSAKKRKNKMLKGGKHFSYLHRYQIKVPKDLSVYKGPENIYLGQTQVLNIFPQKNACPITLGRIESMILIGRADRLSIFCALPYPWKFSEIYIEDFLFYSSRPLGTSPELLDRSNFKGDLVTCSTIWKRNCELPQKNILGMEFLNYMKLLVS